jgi:hypothetical protein
LVIRDEWISALKEDLGSRRTLILVFPKIVFEKTVDVSFGFFLPHSNVPDNSWSFHFRLPTLPTALIGAPFANFT